MNRIYVNIIFLMTTLIFAENINVSLEPDENLVLFTNLDITNINSNSMCLDSTSVFFIDNNITLNINEVCIDSNLQDSLQIYISNQYYIELK